MDFKNPDTALLSEKKLYIFDMDGTIYLGYNVFDFGWFYCRIEQSLSLCSVFLLNWRILNDIWVSFI